MAHGSGGLIQPAGAAPWSSYAAVGTVVPGGPMARP